jgi:double zinc ribbon protein
MLELIAGLLLASGAVMFVLRPILRPESIARDSHAADDDEAGADPDDDLSPRAVALRALKEIEFDRATGKLSDADYDGLKVKYTTEALAALRAGEGGAGGGPSPQPLAAAPRSPLPAASCPEHGARPESDAEFCSVCGRRLVAAGGSFCSRCGGALESDARFCGRCGVPVAA